MARDFDLPDLFFIHSFSLSFSNATINFSSISKYLFIQTKRSWKIPIFKCSFFFLNRRDKKGNFLISPQRCLQGRSGTISVSFEGKLIPPLPCLWTRVSFFCMQISRHLPTWRFVSYLHPWEVGSSLEPRLRATFVPSFFPAPLPAPPSTPPVYTFILDVRTYLWRLSNADNASRSFHGGLRRKK